MGEQFGNRHQLVGEGGERRVVEVFGDFAEPIQQVGQRLSTGRSHAPQHWIMDFGLGGRHRLEIFEKAIHGG
jgi:hypothetical protein